MMGPVMNLRGWLPLIILLMGVPALLGAAKEQEPPDKEMLKMMEFLREMEIIKQQELMRELDRAESLAAQGGTSAPQKPVVAKKELRK